MIVNLAKNPEHIPTLAAWHHAEWSALNPGQTIEHRIDKMHCYLSAATVPSMFIWVEQDCVLGSAGLLANDMDTRPECTPWLASVYVPSTHRNQGIGAALVRQVLQHAQAAGYDEVFLFTPDKESFYQNLGWQTLSQEVYRGEAVTVMSIRLADHPASC